MARKKKTNKKFSGVDPAYLDKQRASLRRTHRKSVLFNAQELAAIDTYCKRFKVSRDTVFKAYNELKSLGMIDSTPMKGYYVSNPVRRVFLLLDTYSPYKYELFNALEQRLPANCKVDLYFHQYSEERFNRLIQESAGRYNAYLVMNYKDNVYSEMLNVLDSSKVLLLDFGEFEKERFSYVCQNFTHAFYNCLVSGYDLLSKYRKIVLVYPEDTEHPVSAKTYFKKFCVDYNFPHEIVPFLNEEDINKKTAYLIIKHSMLLDFIKMCRVKKYVLGEDVGVFVYNDEPVYEILENGITTISCDFRDIGNLASDFVATGKRIQTDVPTKLIVRNSL